MPTEDHPYSPLGYPLTNLPRPGKPVSSLLVHDTVHPLLHGARALVTAVSVGLRTGGSRRRTRQLGARADRGPAGERVPYLAALGRDPGPCPRH